MADINLIPAVVVWIILAIATLGLALYRKLISAGEEDLIHLGPGEERQIPRQVALEARLRRLRRVARQAALPPARSRVSCVSPQTRAPTR